MTLWRGGLYAIVDADLLAARNLPLRLFAEQLRAAGIGVLQLRDKHGSPERILATAAILRDVFAGSGTLLVMNDRADLARLAGFSAVHVGQGDLPVDHAREIAGLAGVSTHTPEEVAANLTAANLTAADYIAIGPVFATSTKPDAEPAVGLEGVRRARALTAKPLVAIGGITRGNARAVLDAGADSVAVISALLPPAEPTTEVVRDFFRIFR